MVRVIFFCFLLCFMVYGCKAVQTYRDDYAACAADPECNAKMLALSSKTQAVVAGATVPLGVPMPLENILAQLFGMLASALGGIMYGKKLRSVRSTDK